VISATCNQRRRPNRAATVLEALRVRFAIDRGLTADWTKRLGWLFDLRDQALHPRWALQGTVPHPSGLPVNVSPRQVDYSANSVVTANDVMIEILTTCVTRSLDTASTT
jgi:hypothetical protein